MVFFVRKYLDKLMDLLIVSHILEAYQSLKYKFSKTDFSLDNLALDFINAFIEDKLIYIQFTNKISFNPENESFIKYAHKKEKNIVNTRVIDKLNYSILRLMAIEFYEFCKDNRLELTNQFNESDQITELYTNISQIRHILGDLRIVNIEPNANLRYKLLILDKAGNLNSTIGNYYKLKCAKTGERVSLVAFVEINHKEMLYFLKDRKIFFTNAYIKKNRTIKIFNHQEYKDDLVSMNFLSIEMCNKILNDYYFQFIEIYSKSFENF